MKIRSTLVASFTRPQNSLPLESRVLKIEQETEIETGDVQVANHLSRRGLR